MSLSPSNPGASASDGDEQSPYNEEEMNARLEVYSTKSLRGAEGGDKLWPPKDASDEEHLKAQKSRKHMYDEAPSRAIQNEKAQVTFENASAMRVAAANGVRVKHFTGDPERPYETKYTDPRTPQTLDREKVNEWAK